MNMASPSQGFSLPASLAAFVQAGNARRSGSAVHRSGGRAGLEPCAQKVVYRRSSKAGIIAMKRSILIIAAAALTAVSATSADARACRRLNKTEGAVVGALGGAVLGNVIAGRGSHGTGTILGAAAGGVAGHEIARTKYNRHCRPYRHYRRTRRH
jgi:osmotically inducible lipoprotein OsmB